MSMRSRVAIAIVVVSAPAVALAGWAAWSAQRDAMAGATYSAVIGHMAAGGRERCEEQLAHWELAPFAAPGRHGAFARGRRALPPRFAGLLHGARIYAYDEALSSSTPGAPRLDDDTREALHEGKPYVHGHADNGARGLAMHMPWSDGPCAVLFVVPRSPQDLERLGPARPLVATFLVIALCVLVAVLALRSPVARLRKLALDVRAAGREGYRRGTTVTGADEIGEVARAFDEAAAEVRAQVERLEKRDRALTAYVDGTTHDVAIPLTVLQSRLAEMDSLSRTHGNVAPELVQSALAECQYLSQLVSNLATAARLEHGEPELTRRSIDLVALVERVATRFEPVARHAGISFEHGVPEASVVVDADDLLLERAVSNLVHNAIRHGARAPDGRVALVLELHRTGYEKDTPRFAIRVLDDGQLSDAAFLAMTRGEPVPEQAHRPRGSGLGLRIVRAVTAAHGYTFSVERGPEGVGVAVAIEGPVA